jgi:presenilin-like A22 family membrane protease
MTTASAIATFLSYREWWIHGDLLGVALGMTIMTMIGIYTTILGDHNDMQ